MIDLDPPKRNGRPPLPDDQRRVHTVGVSFTESEFEALTRAASDKGARVQVIIRRAVDTMLASSKIELTDREREIFPLVAAGHSNKLIGELIGISEHTTKFHIMNLMDKLGVETRAQVAAAAVRMGFA